MRFTIPATPRPTTTYVVFDVPWRTRFFRVGAGVLFAFAPAAGVGSAVGEVDAAPDEEPIAALMHASMRWPQLRWRSQ